MFALKQKFNNRTFVCFGIVGVYRLHKKTGATAPVRSFYLPIKNNINIINITSFVIIKSTSTPPNTLKSILSRFLIFDNIIIIKVVF